MFGLMRLSDILATKEWAREGKEWDHTGRSRHQIGSLLGKTMLFSLCMLKAEGSLYFTRQRTCK
jgi:hypothetical protein